MAADKEDWGADFDDAPPAPKVKLSLPAEESNKNQIKAAHREEVEEKWDDDFDSGDGKPVASASKERHSSSNPSEASESENWDAEFEGI